MLIDQRKTEGRKELNYIKKEQIELSHIVY